MREYSYRAYNEYGEVIEGGLLEAQSVAAARRRIRERLGRPRALFIWEDDAEAFK